MMNVTSTRRFTLGGMSAAMLALPLLAAAVPSEAQGVLLGQKRIDGRRDRDTIEVHERGRFRGIAFRVNGGNAVIRDVVVHFENGQRFRPETRELFLNRQMSRVIDLPGRHRDIDRITFRYGSLRPSRRPTVSVFGIR